MSKRANKDNLPEDPKRYRPNNNQETMFEVPQEGYKREFMQTIPNDSLCAAYMNIREQMSQQQRFHDYVLMHLNKKTLLFDAGKKTLCNNKFIAEDLKVSLKRKEALTSSTLSTMMDHDSKVVVGVQSMPNFKTTPEITLPIQESPMQVDQDSNPLSLSKEYLTELLREIATLLPTQLAAAQAAQLAGEAFTGTINPNGHIWNLGYKLGFVNNKTQQIDIPAVEGQGMAFLASPVRITDEENEEVKDLINTGIPIE